MVGMPNIITSFGFGQCSGSERPIASVQISFVQIFLNDFCQSYFGKTISIFSVQILSSVLCEHATLFMRREQSFLVPVTYSQVKKTFYTHFWTDLYICSATVFTLRRVLLVPVNDYFNRHFCVEMKHEASFVLSIGINNDTLPNCIKYLPKYAQNFAKYKVTPIISVRF